MAHGLQSEPPYNNRFERTSLGRHGLCLRKAHAGDPPHLSLRAKRSGLVRRLNRFVIRTNLREENEA
jgi:hypothetical protein